MPKYYYAAGSNYLIQLQDYIGKAMGDVRGGKGGRWLDLALKVAKDIDRDKSTDEPFSSVVRYLGLAQRYHRTRSDEPETALHYLDSALNFCQRFTPVHEPAMDTDSVANVMAKKRRGG